MAVATNEVIRTYTSWDQHLKTELVGHVENIRKLLFAPQDRYIDENYTLVCEAENYGPAKHNSIIIWHIDGAGRSITRTVPFAIDNLADKSLGAIEMGLQSRHGLFTPSVAETRTSLADSSKKADTKNRMSKVRILAGSFPDFRSEWCM